MSGITIKTSATFNENIELKASSTTIGQNDKKKAEITYIDGVSSTSAFNYTFSNLETRLIMSVNNQNENPGAIQLLNINPENNTVQYSLAPLRSNSNIKNNRSCNYKLGLAYKQKDNNNDNEYSYRWDRVFVNHPENLQSDTLLKNNKLKLGTDIPFDDIRPLYENVHVYRSDVKVDVDDDNTETEFTIVAQELETAINDTNNTNLDFLIEESSDEQIFDDSLGTNGEYRNVKTLCPNNINYMNMYMIKTLLDDPIINGSFTLRDNSTDKTQLLNINSDGAFEFGANGTGYGTAGQILQSQGNSASPEWKNYTLSELNDTTLTNLSNNDILVYNSANSKWENSNNLTLSGNIISTSSTFTNFNITGSGSQNNKIGTSTIYNSTITGGVDETNNGYIEIDRLKTLTGQGRTGLTLKNDSNGGGSSYHSEVKMQYHLDIWTAHNSGPISSNQGNINLTAYNGNINLSASGKISLASFNDINLTASNNINFTAGGLVLTNGIVVLSDDRIKHNEVNIINGLDIVRQIVPQKYHKTKEMYEENYTGNDYRIESGFIAQDILKIPDLTYCVSGGDYIDENNNNVKSKYYLAYQDIFVYGMAATKELDTIVQNQQTTINELNTKISNLEAENISLKEDNTLLKEENTLIKSKLNEILTEMGKETI